MTDLLSTKFRVLLDYLNTGCDPTTAAFIENNYYRFAAISMIYPVMNSDKPWICFMYLVFLIYFVGVMIFICFVFVITCHELYKIDLVLFVHEVHIMLLVWITLIILVNSWFKRSAMVKLHRLMSRNFYDYREDVAEYWSILWKDMKNKRVLCFKSVLSIIFGCFACMVITPTVNKLTGVFINNTRTAERNVNFDIPVPYSTPFVSTDVLTMSMAYVSTFSVAGLVGLLNSTKIFMTFDCYLDVRMHLKLLLYQLETIDVRAEKLYFRLYGVLPHRKSLTLYSERFSMCYNICLKRNIEHHHIIIRASNALSEVAGFYVFFFYLVSIANIAMTMITVSAEMEYPGFTISSIIFCALEITFMALFAHVGQSITDLSSELREQIYTIPWYQCDERVKRTVKILQIATLKPIRFSFYSLLIVNYDSFSTVLNSAYSFYNLINAAD